MYPKKRKFEKRHTNNRNEKNKVQSKLDDEIEINQ